MIYHKFHDENYIVTVAINLTDDYEFNECKLGTITVTTHDSFDTIIYNINQLLHNYNLIPINAFHYIEEDGDINYINRSNADMDDLYNAIKFHTTFYVYYNY